MANLTIEQHQAMIAHYEAGQSIHEIAREFGCAFQTVSKHLQKAGVAIRDRSAATKAGRASNPESGRTYSFDTRREMVSLYESGQSSIEIAALFQCSPGSVQNYVREAGLVLRDPDRFSDADRQSAIAAYLTGRSAGSIARELGCSTRCVTNWLNAAEVERRSLSDARLQRSLNERAFEAIETDAQAYWLGFLTADGGISDRDELRVNLQLRDREHLERLREFLELSTPIREAHSRGVSKKTNEPWERRCVYLDLLSHRLCSDLRAHGIEPRKSKTCCFNDRLPSHLYGAYARGLFDGDGTYCSLYRGNIQWRLVGNRPFLLAFQRMMMGHAETRQTQLTAHHTTPEIAYLVYGGVPQVVRIARWMYRDATVFLPRKLHCFVEYLRRHGYTEGEDFAELIAEGESGASDSPSNS